MLRCALRWRKGAFLEYLPLPAGWLRHTEGTRSFFLRCFLTEEVAARGAMRRHSACGAFLAVERSEGGCGSAPCGAIALVERFWQWSGVRRWPRAAPCGAIALVERFWQWSGVKVAAARRHSACGAVVAVEWIEDGCGTWLRWLDCRI